MSEKSPSEKYEESYENLKTAYPRYLNGLNKVKGTFALALRDSFYIFIINKQYPIFPSAQMLRYLGKPIMVFTDKDFDLMYGEGCNWYPFGAQFKDQ